MVEHAVLSVRIRCPNSTLSMKSLFFAIAMLLMPAFVFADAPALSAVAAVVQSGGKANITGKVTGGGVDVKLKALFGKTNAYGAEKELQLTAVGTDMAFTISLTALEEGATYHFKVTADNATDPVVESADATFLVPPVLVVSAPTVLPGGKVRIAGTVTTGNFATTITVSYGKDANYGATRSSQVTASALNSTFSVDLTGLDFGTEYHFKVNAKNTATGVTTADATFTTPTATSPAVAELTVGSYAADSNGKVSAKVTAKITANGANTAAALSFGKTTAYGAEQTRNVSKFDVDKVVTFDLSGLAIGSTYHYRLIANNGIDPSNDSGDQQFTVPPLKPQFLDFKAGKASVTQFVNVLSETTAEITVLVDPQGSDAEIAAKYLAGTVTAGVTPVYNQTADAPGSPDAPAILPDGKKRSDFKTKILLTGLIKGAYQYQIEATNTAGTQPTGNLSFLMPSNASLETKHELKGHTGATITAKVTAHGAPVDLTFTLTSSGKTQTIERQAAVAHDGVDQRIAVDFSDLTPGALYTYAVVAIHPGEKGISRDTGRFITSADFKNGIAGVNSGLIKDENGDVAGAYKVLASKGGKFTARVTIGGKSYVVTGELGEDGTFQTTTPSGLFMQATATSVPGKNATAPALMKLGLDFARQDGNYTAENIVNQVTKSRMKELAGLYTVSLPAPGTVAVAGQTSNGLPQGAGFMRMTAKEWGGVSVQGVLGDGSKFSYGGTLAGTDAASAIPVWLSPKNARVQGIMTLAGSDTITAGGDLKWYRPPNEDSSKFAEGFFTTLTAKGSAYAPPEKRQRVLGSDTSGATITFQGGNLATTITRNIDIDRNNRVTMENGIVSKVTINPGSGTFTGRFEHPVDGEMHTFQGVLLPNQNVATGVFAGQDQTGTVKITPGKTTTPVVQQPQQQPGNNTGINLGNTGNVNLGR